MHVFMGMKSYICFEKSEGGSTLLRATTIEQNHAVYKIIYFTIGASNTWISA